MSTENCIVCEFAVRCRRLYEYIEVGQVNITQETAFIRRIECNQCRVRNISDDARMNDVCIQWFGFVYNNVYEPQL